MSTLRRALYVGRMFAALALLRACKALPASRLTWRLFRWSMQCAPHVTAAERDAAVRMWDLQGYAWGFRSRIPARRGDPGASIRGEEQRAQAPAMHNAAIARSVRRHYRKLHKQARRLIRGTCNACAGRGYDGAGEECMYCHGSGKTETEAWATFLLLRGAPRWLVNGEAGPPDNEEGASND